MVDEWPLSQLRPTIADPPASASGSSGEGRAVDEVNEDLHPVESSSNENEDEDEERAGEQMDVDDPPEPSKRLRRKAKSRAIGKHRLHTDSTHFHEIDLVAKEPRRRAPKRGK